MTKKTMNDVNSAKNILEESMGELYKENEDMVKGITDKLMEIGVEYFVNQTRENVREAIKRYDTAPYEFKSIVKDISKNISGGLMTYGRVKSLSSIICKIFKKQKQVRDVYAMTFIVNSQDECYQMVKDIKEIYPTSNEKDYINTPKENGYRALHMTTMVNNKPCEIQIKTPEMEYEARYGSAAHDKKYKSLEAEVEKVFIGTKYEEFVKPINFMAVPDEDGVNLLCVEETALKSKIDRIIEEKMGGIKKNDPAAERN